MAWKKLLTCTAVAVSLLTAPAFIPNAGAEKMRKVSFRLAWIPSGQYCYALVARKLGFWRKLGLDVKIHRGFGSSKTSQEISTGQFDVGEASFGPAILVISKGGSLVGMGARYQKSPMGVATLKKTPLKTAKDIEGLTLASSPGSGSHTLFPAFARSAGIDANKVKWLMISPAAYKSSLLAGKVDAVSTYIVSFAPGLIGRGIKYNFVFYADHGFDMLDQTFWARPDRFKKDRNLYRKFVQGALKGIKHTFLEPEESIKITMGELPIYGKGKVSYKIIEAGLGVASAISSSAHTEKHGIGWMEPSLVKDSLDRVVKYMGAAPIKDINSIYTNEFIGGEKLTPAQWKKVRDWSMKFLPSS
jgi:NitT/TauT family transport system substrate-binding protein